MPATLTRTSIDDRPAPVVDVSTFRVVVADDHQLYRDGIVRALQAHGGFAVVGEASDGDEALRLVREHEPDIALLDVRMPGLDGVDVVHALALHGPETAVVMLSAFSEAALVESALVAGAAGYLGKGEDRDALCEQLSTIAEHHVRLTPRRLSPHDPVARSGRWLPRLTRAEHQLLRLADDGLDKLQIADALGLAEHEVRTRAASITRKLDSDGLADAVARARSCGLLR